MAKGDVKEEVLQEVFPKEVLREHCKELFQIEKEVFDGVFSTLDTEISIEDAKKSIDDWMKKEVK